MNCLECYGNIGLPNDAIDGELVTCNECGSSFEIEISGSGAFNLKQAETVGEDWGE
jgi:alpha-aminoadipate/glutamate carrier protein LysW